MHFRDLVAGALVDWLSGKGVDMPHQKVFTIGHSAHDVDYFIGLLKKHEVNCLIDVRSQPYSRIAPQFNKDRLSSDLKNHGILYAHFEKEFGARHTEPSLLDVDNKVDFDKVRASVAFNQGIQRLRQALDLGYTIALMCSEANPLDCHRFSMISYQLRKVVEMSHILRNGNLKDNGNLEKELLDKYNKKLDPLFDTEEQQIEKAYRLRGKDIAFSVQLDEEKHRL